MYYQCFHFSFGGLHIIGRCIFGNLNNRRIRRCFRLCRGRVNVRISITCQSFRFYSVFFVVILRNLRVFWVLGGFCFLVIFVSKLKGISDGQCKSLSLKRRRKVQNLTSLLRSYLFPKTCIIENAIHFPELVIFLVTEKHFLCIWFEIMRRSVGRKFCSQFTNSHEKCIFSYQNTIRFPWIVPLTIVMFEGHTRTNRFPQERMR